MICKWNHIMCILLFLHLSLKIMVMCDLHMLSHLGQFLHFYWLYGIPVHIARLQPAPHGWTFGLPLGPGDYEPRCLLYLWSTPVNACAAEFV